MDKEDKCDGCELRDKRIRDLEQMMRTIAEAVDKMNGRLKDARTLDTPQLGRATWQKNGL